MNDEVLLVDKINLRRQLVAYYVVGVIVSSRPLKLLCLVESFQK